MFDFETIRITDFTLAVLKINQEIAAYFFGFKIEKNIEINRVVINDDFKFFSPGLFLFHEYIKKEIPQLEGIDLTVGDEKYKFDLGGKPHIIYNLKVSI
jgi:CelD/BcsL family acetyltransferase involved in cellulose biosynthesis